ncbi:MAG: hypothetical protein IPH54_12810 [Rhodoferax sp.]|nr:hypothetical protein [Rhodoferax sp.]
MNSVLISVWLEIAGQPLPIFWRQRFDHWGKPRRQDGAGKIDECGYLEGDQPK